METRARSHRTALSARKPSVREQIASLSGGQRQTVATARSLLLDPKLIMLDEPTAALGVQETARVEETIRRMRERGLAVLMVSHNLDQVFRLADRVYVLRRGVVVGERVPAETHVDEIVGLITGSASAAARGGAFA